MRSNNTHYIQLTILWMDWIGTYERWLFRSPSPWSWHLCPHGTSILTPTAFALCSSLRRPWLD